jgi:hypothetical protein
MIQPRQFFARYFFLAAVLALAGALDAGAAAAFLAGAALAFVPVDLAAGAASLFAAAAGFFAIAVVPLFAAGIQLH